eukprot:SAG11_NODE_3609_length_2342_cov_1.734730_2_plen_50_part_00
MPLEWNEHIAIRIGVTVLVVLDAIGSVGSFLEFVQVLELGLLAQANAFA